MIEVEKKFKLTPASRELLIKDAMLVSEKTFTDIYFDTADWVLTKKDWWLRKRGDVFELKIPLHTSTERQADQYEELTEESKIGEAIGFAAVGSFEQDATAAGYAPCCIVTTHRTTYHLDSFAIDIDEVTGDGFVYQLAEIELMVEHESDMPSAVDSIMTLATARGLETGYVRGKVLEYLKQKSPRHFQALIDAGVVSAHNS